MPHSFKTSDKMGVKAIVFGGRGQLGQALSAVSQLKKTPIEFLFLSRSEGDITDTATLYRIFSEHSPEYVINCAAYTAVDQAESDSDKAQLINVQGAENLAKLCQKYSSILIHISTDFVFGMNEGKALKEEDLPQPESVYGKTKWEGEKAVTAVLPEHFIIRTSWLYGEYGHNFYKTMLRLAASKKELGIVGDQIGSPTYTGDLATAIIAMIQSGSKSFGTYHYSNEGVASWYDFAKCIFEISGIGMKVKYLRSLDYPTPAKRPSFSLLEKHKIKTTFSLDIPHWKDSLKKCINNKLEP